MVRHRVNNQVAQVSVSAIAATHAAVSSIALSAKAVSSAQEACAEFIYDTAPVRSD